VPWFEIQGNRFGGYWWRLKAANGEIVCHSEKYATKSACYQSIAWVKANAPVAQIVDKAA
jgi:uncharacterized protein YegP (UPF0339 family)